MAPGKKSVTEPRLDSMQLTELRARRVELQSDLVQADASLATARQAGIAARIQRTNGIDHVEIIRRAETDRELAVNSLAEIERLIAEGEAHDRDEADKHMRGETAQKIEAIALRFDTIQKPIADLLVEALEVAELGIPFYGDIGLLTLLKNLQQELAPAYEVLAAELRLRAKETLEGRGSPHMPAPPPSVTIVAEPPRVEIFPLTNFTYGKDGRCPAHVSAFVELDVAARAVQRGFALPANDPRIRELSKSMVQGFVARIGHRFLDLDKNDLNDMPSLYPPAAQRPSAAIGAGPGLPQLPEGMEFLPKTGQTYVVPMGRPSHEK